MKKAVSPITISHCFLACKPWCIMFILTHMFLSKRESASNILQKSYFVQKNYFRTYLNLAP